MCGDDPFHHRWPLVSHLLLQAPLDATLQRLDALVGQLHAALPPNTLLILHTGQVSPLTVWHEKPACCSSANSLLMHGCACLS
jgi:hypothetical protein